MYGGECDDAVAATRLHSKQGQQQATGNRQQAGKREGDERRGEDADA
jgi:hypothetical protein